MDSAKEKKKMEIQDVGNNNSDAYKKILVVTKSSILILSIDQILRWVSLSLYNFSIISSSLFWMLNLMFIICFTAIIAFLISKTNKKKIRKQFKQISSQITFEHDKNDRNGLIAFIFSILSCVITYYLLKNSINSIFLLIPVSISAGIFYFFLVVVYNSGIQSKNISVVYEVMLDGKKKLLPNLIVNKPSQFPVQIEEVDEINELDKNDVAIVELMSRVKNMGLNADSYLLESVLLGGLAFSGFLNITSEKGLDSSFFSDFFSLVTSCTNDFLGFSFNNLPDKFLNLTSGLNLFALISIETLLCSMFFLLVIAIRFQFSKYLEKIDYLVRIAETFNLKEEEINIIILREDSTDKKKKLGLRLNNLSKRIDLSLNDANSLLTQTSPIMTYMAIFRNIGVGLFYLILITCGMLFSYGFSLFILTIAIFAIFYTKTQTFFDLRKFRNTLSRHIANKNR